MVANLNTNSFFYDSKSRIFSAEASEIGFKPGLAPLTINLESSRTGKIARFVLNYIEEDGSLKFETSADPLSQMGVTLVVFND